MAGEGGRAISSSLELAGEAEARPDQPLSTIAAGLTVGTVALMILGVQPVLLGGLAEAGRITDRGLGPLATVEVLMIALGSAVGPAFARGGGLRAKTFALGLVLVALDIAVVLAHGWWPLAVARSAAGLVEGLLMGVTILVTIQHRHPDRLNAIFLAVSAIPQAVLAWLLPIWITPRFGANGGFVALAAISVAAVVSAIALPRRATVVAAPHLRALFGRRALIALAAIGLQNAAIGGAWAYVEQLAAQHGFPPYVAGIAVSGGLVVQVVGALLAGAFGRLAPFRTALVVGSLLQAGVIAALALAGAPLAYLVPALGFGLLWLAMSPFQVRLLIDIDPTRVAAEMLTAVALVGLSLGPALAALGVAGHTVTGAFWVSTGLMLASTVLYLALGGTRTAA